MNNKILQFLKKRKVIRGVMIVVLFIVVLFSFFYECVPMNDGAGWDGVLYRKMASNFLGMIHHDNLSAYYIQKCLPFAAINIVDAFLHNNNHEITLRVFILITLSLSVFGFYKISNHLELSMYAEIIAFALSFYIYPVLKLHEYYPWLGDGFAYCLGIWIYYFFLTKQQNKMLVVSVIAAFVWQSILLVSIIIYILPTVGFSLTNGKNVSINQGKCYEILKASIALLMTVPPIILFIYSKLQVGWWAYSYQVPYCYQHNHPYWVVLIATLCMCILVYLIVRPFNFSIKDFVVTLWKNIEIKKIGIALAVYIGVKLAIGFLANPTMSESSTMQFAKRIMWEPYLLPLKFMEMHMLYYGMLLPLLILCYKDFIDYISEHSIGYIAVIMLIFIFGTQTESRFIINFIPFIVFPIATVISRLDLQHWIPSALCFIQFYTVSCVV